MTLELRTTVLAAVYFTFFALPLPRAHSQIDLGMIPPATSVSDADRTFQERAAAVTAYTAQLPLTEANGDPLQHPLEAILGRLAYLDYFPNDRDIGFRKREEAFQSILSQYVTAEVGTDIEEPFRIPEIGLDLIVARRIGDYDFILTGYTLMLHKYRDIMPAHVTDHLINVLLNQHGKLDRTYLSVTMQIISLGNVLTPIPETENHVLMIYAARYLANQIRYELTRHSDYDNSQNGMTEFMLERLAHFLKHDFIEYNSRPYQQFIMLALLNLHSFAQDLRVKVLAQMVLDYISAKVAVSSNDTRRAVPYRRTIKYYCSNLITNDCGHNHGPDPQTAYYMMLAGVTDMLPVTETFVGPIRYAPWTYAEPFQRVALNEYRLPGLIHDLLVNRAHRSFHQHFRHYGSEIYSGSPSYLISAGGFPTDAAYVVELPFPIGRRFKADDLGMVLPTTVMPTQEKQGQAISDLIRFESPRTYLLHGLPFDPNFSLVQNMGVAPDFACGLVPVIPAHYTSGFTCWSEEHTAAGTWTFIDRGDKCPSDAPHGYYVAVFRGTLALIEGTPAESVAFGFLEMFDTYSNPGTSFEQFRQGVLARNGTSSFYSNEKNVYATTDGRAIEFICSPGSEILSINGIPTVVARTSGTILNSDGAGLVTIDNPALRKRLVLDARNVLDPVRFEDVIGGPEVWVDFDYSGDELGTYAQPFNSLEEGVAGVPPGGMVKLLPGSRFGPIAIGKAMTLVAPRGRVTLGQ